MHFPDSVLSPSTCAVTGAIMLPVWALAGRRIRASLGTRQVPMLALGAAFCFTIMMFNLPALGGTTAHPVAGTLIAVLLGPWAAVLGVSVALAIQALFFGDGGLLAYGANCFAMAYALPFVGYGVYRALSARLPAASPYRALWAGVGAFAGVNMAAAVVAVLLGVQPAFFHEPNGQPLYFPYGLAATLPAMLSTHLLIAGPAEAIVTALVVRYMQRAGFPLYGTAPAESGTRQGRYEPLWVGMLALIALTPLGLIAQGAAWGEWGTDEMAARLKQDQGREYLPKGFAAAEEKSHKGIPGLEEYGGEKGAKGYWLAAALGVGATSLLFLLAGRLLSRTDTDNDDPNPPDDGATEPPNETTTGALPSWLSRPSEETNPPPNESGPKTNPFIARTLTELAEGVSATLRAERWARQDGFLQRLDPRAKLVAALGWIALSATLRAPLALATLYGATVALGLASRLPLGVLLRRVWLSVTLFAGAMVAPTLLNVVTPGRVLVTLWREPSLAITEPGVFLATTFVLRIAVAVSCAALLTMTTPWNSLLHALRLFFVPRLFVNVLAMTYRYLIVVMETAAEMVTARKSRTVGYATNQDGRRYAGAGIGALFGKTLALSEEVHAAMLARGYTGEAQPLSQLRWRTADTLWVTATALFAAAVWQWTRLGGAFSG